MRKSLKVVAFGGDPADAFLKAAGITDATITSAIKTLVSGLQADGLWSKMKAIYPMVGGNATAHSYNLKDTTKFQITFNGGWTHSSTGAKPNGTNGYANTFLTPSSVLTDNSNGLSMYLRTNLTESSPDTVNMGSMIGIAQALTLASPTSTSLGGRANAALISGTITTRAGLSSINRTSETVTSVYKNGSQIATGTSAGPLPTVTVYIGTLNLNNTAYSSGYTLQEFAFASINEGLSNTDNANLYTRIQTFQTSLSRQV